MRRLQLGEVRRTQLRSVRWLQLSEMRGPQLCEVLGLLRQIEVVVRIMLGWHMGSLRVELHRAVLWNRVGVHGVVGLNMLGIGRVPWLGVHLMHWLGVPWLGVEY